MGDEGEERELGGFDACDGEGLHGLVGWVMMIMNMLYACKKQLHP